MSSINSEYAYFKVQETMSDAIVKFNTIEPVAMPRELQKYFHDGIPELEFGQSHLHQGPRTPDRESTVLHQQSTVTIPLAIMLLSVDVGGGNGSVLAGESLDSLMPVIDIDSDTYISNIQTPHTTLRTQYKSYWLARSGVRKGANYSVNQIVTSKSCDTYVKQPKGTQIIKHSALNSRANTVDWYMLVTGTITGYDAGSYSGQARLKRAWYLAVSVDVLLDRIAAYADPIVRDHLKYSHSGWKIPPFPVEETLLESFYDEFDRPTFNGWAAIFDVVGGIRSARKMSDLISKIGQAGSIRKYLSTHAPNYIKEHANLKTASDLYLTKKYVFDTTGMDVDDFFSKLSSRLSRPDTRVFRHRFPVYTTRSYGRDVFAQHCVRIHYLKPEQSAASLYGFDLPLEATWDLLPWSFVVDWFTGIGSCLESIEQLESIQQLNIVSCTESVKQISHYTLTDKVSHTSVVGQTTIYRRDASTTLPPIYPSSPSISNPFYHLSEATALFISHKH